MVGWNIEIMFMFAISGIIYADTISGDQNEKIPGIPNWWFWDTGYSGFCFFVEVLLNIGALLEAGNGAGRLTKMFILMSTLRRQEPGLSGSVGGCAGKHRRNRIKPFQLVHQ